MRLDLDVHREEVHDTIRVMDISEDGADVEGVEDAGEDLGVAERVEDGNEGEVEEGSRVFA